MKIKQILPVICFLVVSTMISACTGVAMNTSWPGVSASTDLAFVSNGGQVYAVKLADGTQAWRFPDKADPSKPFFADPMLTADNQLLVGDYGNTGTLYSLDPGAGTEKWKFAQTQGRWVASPLVVNDTIYAPNADGNLYVLSLKGELQWKFPARSALWSQPVADQQNVYITSLDHYLYAVNMSSHRQAWSVNLGAGSVGSPALGKDGTLFVGTLGNELLAIQSNNGAIKWRIPTSGNVWGAPVFHDDSLFLGDLAGNVYSIAPDSGKINWTFAAGGPVTGSPAILTDGLVIITETGGLTGVSFDGKAKSMGSKPDAGSATFFGTPVLAGDGMVLMAATGSGPFLYAYSNTGTPKWSFTPPK